METQAEAVARIALEMDWNLSDSKETTKKFLQALNHAFQAGWSAGYTSGTRHQLMVQDMVLKALGQ